MMKSVKKTWLASLVALVVVAALVGCSKKSEEASSDQASSAPETKAAATPIDKSTVGSVSGTVKFDGTKPKAAKIDMSQDPACAKKGENTVETYAGDGASLANVFVYVKSGLDKYSFDTPTTPVEINQEGCRYHPHVIGVMVNQPVKIVNSDQTTHNIHPTPANNREWNESQAPGQAPLDKTFAREEIMLPVKCNQHPWMKMYINVVKTPYFAVTDDKGNYTIKDVPPGNYTIEVWQEKLGTEDQKADVKDGQTANVNFTMKPKG